MASPIWMNKKPRPEYEKEERDFAKANGARPTISSGRFGFHKGDSTIPQSGGPEDFLFTFDNKGTHQLAYRLDVRFWLGFKKRVQLSGRIPVLVVRFYHHEDRKTEDLIVMPRSEWEAMRDVVYDKKSRGRSVDTRLSKTKRARTVKDSAGGP